MEISTGKQINLTSQRPSSSSVFRETSCPNVDSFIHNTTETAANRVFHSLHKVGRNGSFVFKRFHNSKRRVTSSAARPDATDYYWFRSPVPNQMS